MLLGGGICVGETDACTGDEVDGATASKLLLLTLPEELLLLLFVCDCVITCVDPLPVVVESGGESGVDTASRTIVISAIAVCWEIVFVFLSILCVCMYEGEIAF
jgi:hypothetical protein